MFRKIIPYILILITLIGLFGPSKASAIEQGVCKVTTTAVELVDDGSGGYKNETKTYENDIRQNPPTLGSCTKDNANVKAECQSHYKEAITQKIDCNVQFVKDIGGGTINPDPETKKPSDKSAFEQEVDNASCRFLTPDPGCLTKFLYYGLYTPAAFLLSLSAKFFNALLAISLDGDFLRKPFVAGAWGVVRDLSNIFFIIVLLYAAFETILGIGHGAKGIVAKVLIVALLINFSMFFTQVVIDSTNVLALVFYNKLSPVDKSGNPITDTATTTNEKNISGAIWNAFDVTKLIQPTFFDQVKKESPDHTVGPGILMGVIIVGIAIMGYAAYCFLASGIFFVARLIELFILIIFSPFAFVSYAAPFLEHTEYLGWDSWLKRLFKVGFMAPIFMFFLYFIFLLLKENIFSGVLGQQASMIQMILAIVIPAMLILILLQKATKFAQEGSGAIGEALMKGAKLAGGLALGAATGGASMAASNSLGRIGRNMANNEDVKARAAAGDKGAQRRLAIANSLAKSSFDIRDTGLGKFAEKQSGMNFSKGLGALSSDKLKDGRKGRDKEKAKKEDDTRKTYMMSDAHAQKQDDRNKQYEKDLEQAEKNLGGEFNERDKAQFKKDYEEGKDLSTEYGINKKTEKGSVDSSKDINADRQRAYALSLQNPTMKLQDGKEIRKGFLESFKGFGSSWGTGMVKMVATPGGLATTTAIGALTGGVGAAIAIPIGGLAFAIKDLSSALAQRTRLGNMALGEHEDTVAAVRKGVKSSIEDALHHLNEAAGVEHGHGEEKHEEKGHGDKAHDETKHEDKGGGDKKEDTAHGPKHA